MEQERTYENMAESWAQELRDLYADIFDEELIQAATEVADLISEGDTVGARRAAQEHAATLGSSDAIRTWIMENLFSNRKDP